MKKKDMEKKKNLIIISGIFLIFIIITIIFGIKLPIKKISEDTIGNTAGNLNNGGLYCEYNGKVYFSNAYDNGTLYVMDSDETNVKKLSSSQVSLINASEEYLVFYQSGAYSEDDLGSMVQNRGIYRSDLNGNNLDCLDDSICTALVLTGNQIYYQHYNNKEYTRLYKSDLAGNNISQVEKTIINPHCVAGRTIYFNGTGSDHYLYGLNTSSDAIATIWTGNLYNPVILGNYVYYMDLSNHYGLSRYSLIANEVEILTDDRVDYFNVYGNMIYYQTAASKDPALKRMKIDGSENEIVRDGIYENIHITSRYVYFNEYGKDTPVYHTPTSGNINVNTFNP